MFQFHLHQTKFNKIIINLSKTIHTFIHNHSLQRYHAQGDLRPTEAANNNLIMYRGVC